MAVLIKIWLLTLVTICVGGLIKLIKGFHSTGLITRTEKAL